jgi:hypothetical protein
MTIIEPAPATAAENPAVGDPTPDVPAISSSPRQIARRSVGWIMVGIIAVLIAAIGFLATGGRTGAGTPLDAANAAPAGAKALVEVLRQQGVDVAVASSITQVRDLAPGDGTILVYDPQGFLDENRFTELQTRASTLVVVDPGFASLRALAPDVHNAGTASRSGTLSASCDEPAANRAQTIEPTAKSPTLRISSGSTATASTGCFPTGDGGFAFVSSTANSSTLHLVGSPSIFDNEGIVRAGNAALALNLLGEHRSLVWYLPTLQDVAASGPPDLSALTPGWVTPLVLLLIVVFVAAAVWRGRRFGPLVVENLPVVVRSGETMEGRARLYQRSSARLRALDSLRIGSIGRLAAAVGLASTASVADVCDTVAALTGTDRSSVRDLLVDARPHTDAQLVTLSDRLARLGSATLAAVNPANDRPTGRMEP